MPGSTDPLQPFIDWIMAQGKRSSTALVYASGTRTILNHLNLGISPLDKPTPEQLDAYFEALEPRAERNKRCAWKAYARWRIAQGHDFPIPLEKGKAPKATDAPELPEEVREALRSLKETMPLQTLLLTTWGDVDWSTAKLGPDNKGSILIRNVLGRHGDFFQIEFSLLEAFIAWGGSEEYSHPILPLSPGSSHPYPKGAMLRELKKGIKETPAERVRRLREESKHNLGERPAATPKQAMKVITAENYVPPRQFLPEVDKSKSLGELLGMDDELIPGTPEAAILEGMIIPGGEPDGQ